jgi:hypothetical protein
MVQDTDNRWAAAAIGSHTIDQLELKTGTSLMAIGGFSGGDPSPTLEQFQQYVADGQVHYFVEGGRTGGFGGRGGSSQISTWVQANFTPMTVGGTTVYDLLAPAG